jgi:hypothetical protein
MPSNAIVATATEVDRSCGQVIWCRNVPERTSKFAGLKHLDTFYNGHPTNSSCFCEVADRTLPLAALGSGQTNLWGAKMSKQTEQLDSCPHCKRPFAIEAVSFKIFKPCRALFVCPGCGFAHAEGNEQRSHSRNRIVRFSRGLGNYCGRVATKLLFLLRNRSFRFTSSVTWL